MDCPHLPRKAGLVSLWRLWRCPECRAARPIDKVLARGIARMQAEPAPPSGQARALAALSALYPPRPRSRPRPLWRQLPRPAGLVTLALAGAGYGWVCWSDVDPNVTIPTPAMPRDNAFATLRGVSDALANSEQVGWAVSSKIKPGDKPVSGKPPSFTGISPSGQPSDLLANLRADHIYTYAEKTALLQRNAEALAIFRRALQQPYQAPVHSIDDESSNAYSYLNGYRSLARLLALEQQVRAAQGDWNGAVNSGLDAVQLGGQITRGEGMIGDFTGIACAKIGRKQIWKELPHLDAAEARAAARRLERILALQAPLKDVVQEEKWRYQAEMEHIFHQPGWRFDLFSSSPNDPMEHEISSVVSWLRLLPYTRRRIMEEGSRYMDRQVANARLPFSEQQPRVDSQPEPDSYGRQAPDPPVPDDPVNNLMLVSCDGLRLSHTNERAQNALLLTAASLQAYREDHGVYPARLSQLVPRYLPAVPDDPFAAQGPLRYRRAGARYVLYSVGPDGRDDGGTPIEDMRNDTANRFSVTGHSPGDIVAGVNF